MGFFPWISWGGMSFKGFSQSFPEMSKAFSTEGQCSALKCCGGFDGPSRAALGFCGIQVGFVPMPLLVVEMGSVGVSSAIKAPWDSGCV